MARAFPIALVSLWVPPPPGIVPDHADDINADELDNCCDYWW